MSFLCCWITYMLQFSVERKPIHTYVSMLLRAADKGGLGSTVLLAWTPLGQQRAQQDSPMAIFSTCGTLCHLSLLYISPLVPLCRTLWDFKPTDTP